MRNWYRVKCVLCGEELGAAIDKLSLVVGPGADMDRGRDGVVVTLKIRECDLSHAVKEARRELDLAGYRWAATIRGVGPHQTHLFERKPG